VDARALGERAAERALSAGGYRGVAPVPHWGECGAPTALAAARPATPGATPRRRVGARSAELPGPLRATPEPEPARPGPFALAPSDAHLGVDAPGVARPADRGDGEDPESLAAEMARLEALPRVRREGDVGEVIEGGGRRSLPPESTTDEGVGRVYPEWDASRGRYRHPGCRVREEPAVRRDAGFAERVMAERRVLRHHLRRQLEALRPRRERLRRQTEGDALDLGGWVTDWGDLRAGRPPAGRIYTHERRISRDVAVTLLLDASGSTESWLDGTRRVVDVVKEAALVFGEALASLGDRHSILAFSGQGAADVRVQRLKGFWEPADAAVRARIGGLEPDAFTRLGGALRHATAALAREPARARLLLLLSDGKPQDEDGYEGDYGVEDARQAVAEARLAGVRVFAVTVDREGPHYLARVFGPHGYTVIQDATALPERLPGIYRRLTAGS
jgi:nitric oxide reductase NorD protein